MLVDLNHQLYLGHTDQLATSGLPAPEMVIMKAQMDSDLNRKIWMVLGEGAVFMIILIFGFLRVRKTIFKELDLAGRQNNFLLSVTHELKSPIAAIQLQLQTLRTRNVDKVTQDKIIDSSLKETSRLRSQVEDLLQVARLETGRNSLSMKDVDLAKVTLETLTVQFKDKLDSGRVKFESADNGQVPADKEAVVSIIVNLVENALKYTGVDTTIKVKVSPGRSSTYLTVEDQGVGIPAAEKKKIFDRFYRSGNENTRGAQGTGLGLYIVKQLAEGMNAELELYDNSPTGSVFRVSFRTAGP